MDKETENILAGGIACLGILAYVFILLVGGSIVSGWVLSILWGWFVVPLFSLPHLSIPYAIGLGTVVSMFKNTNMDFKKENDESSVMQAVRLIFKLFIPPLVALGIGWIVLQFV